MCCKPPPPIPMQSLFAITITYENKVCDNKNSGFKSDHLNVLHRMECHVCLY